MFTSVTCKTSCSVSVDTNFDMDMISQYKGTLTWFSLSLFFREKPFELRHTLGVAYIPVLYKIWEKSRKYSKTLPPWNLYFHSPAVNTTSIVIQG